MADQPSRLPAASYDADWKAQKLTEAQYNERFCSDDAEYARMLNLLADALRAPATDLPGAPRAKAEDRDQSADRSP